VLVSGKQVASKALIGYASMKTCRVLSFGLLLAIGGCLTQEQHAYPLTPDGEPRPDNEVGILMGPVAAVDGHDVSSIKGKSFALLPGCHSFRLLGTTGHVENNSGGYITSLPQNTFAILVQAGHYYTFETVEHDNGSPVISVNMSFADHQRDGSVTAARGCHE
jgi:hypothetical protein